AITEGALKRMCAAIYRKEPPSAPGERQSSTIRVLRSTDSRDEPGKWRNPEIHRRWNETTCMKRCHRHFAKSSRYSGPATPGSSMSFRSALRAAEEHLSPDLHRLRVPTDPCLWLPARRASQCLASRVAFRSTPSTDTRLEDATQGSVPAGKV